MNENEKGMPPDSIDIMWKLIETLSLFPQVVFNNSGIEKFITELYVAAIKYDSFLKLKM